MIVSRLCRQCGALHQTEQSRAEEAAVRLRAAVKPSAENIGNNQTTTEIPTCPPLYMSDLIHLLSFFCFFLNDYLCSILFLMSCW